MSMGIIVAVLSFIAVAFLVAALLGGIGTDERGPRRRLRAIERGGQGPRPRRVRGEREDHLPHLTSLLGRSGRYGAIERQLRRAGLNWRPSEFVAFSLVALAALTLAGHLVLGVPGAAGGAAVGVLLPIVTLQALTGQRLRKFEEQLPDALMLVAASLRSGYGILRALQAVKDEMGPPISLDFAEVLDETEVGIPVGDALNRLVQRVPLPDLEIAVTAILIQMDVGGNLAELMETTAATVRERRRLRAEMNTLTAEARLSGVVLFVVPLGMAVALVALNPAYMSALFKTGLGHMLLICAASFQLVGGLVIRRMLRLDL
jgi:tight adherence protein B